jgi:hypothetical protein
LPIRCHVAQLSIGATCALFWARTQILVRERERGRFLRRDADALAENAVRACDLVRALAVLEEIQVVCGESAIGAATAVGRVNVRR